jgi:hypothetical protein
LVLISLLNLSLVGFGANRLLRAPLSFGAAHVSKWFCGERPVLTSTDSKMTFKIKEKDYEQE